MNESIGRVIRRLRRERGLTQEQLAEQLGVSAGTISKWECGAGMPDISQVVPIANLFGVTTDLLFGVHEKDREKEISARLDEIFTIYDRCADGEEGPTALLILDKYREAIRLYPNNPTILGNAMSFAGMVIIENRKELLELIGEEGVEALTEEIVHWAELVIKYGSKIDQILHAKRTLLDVFVRRENWDGAFSLAESFPSEISDLRGVQMADLMRVKKMPSEERRWRCRNISSLAYHLEHETAMLGNLYMREGQYADALSCYTFLRDMVESLYREEKYRPPFVYDSFPLYRYPAICLVKLGQEEQTLTILEEGVSFLLAQAENYNQKKTLDIPLLRDCDFGYGFGGTASYGNVANRMKEVILGKEFAALSENPRYQALLERVGEIERAERGERVEKSGESEAEGQIS